MDIQLLENYSRVGNKRHLWGLARAIDSVAPLDSVERVRLKNNKDKIKRQMGKSINIFTQRPLQDAMLRYCVNDVIHLPYLHRYYFEQVEQGWRYPEEVARVTLVRAMDACSENFVPGSPVLQFGPWGDELPR